MAALDFGMALARGMLPTSEKAQKDLLNLAGGRNIFKSEDWWNKAVDKQIKEGYREVAHTSKEFLTESGDYLPGKRNVNTTYGRTMYGQFYPVTGPFGTPYQPTYHPLFGYGGGIQARTSVSYEAPEGSIFTVDPRTRQKQYTSRNIDVFGSSRKDYTAGELKDIEASAKRGAQQAKRTVAESQVSRKRRGTGGVLAKAILPGDKPSTGLPLLGLTGLGLTTTALGKGLEL